MSPLAGTVELTTVCMFSVLRKAGDLAAAIPGSSAAVAKENVRAVASLRRRLGPDMGRISVPPVRPSDLTTVGQWPASSHRGPFDLDPSKFGAPRTQVHSSMGLRSDFIPPESRVRPIQPCSKSLWRCEEVIRRG